jgi:hypothetical protein
LKCACPIWMDWRISGKRIRKPLGLRDWQVAQQRARDMEATGFAQAGVPLTIEESFQKFVADAEARNLRKAKLRKYKLTQRKLTEFCRGRGLVFLRQLSVDEVREFRNGWWFKNCGPQVCRFRYCQRRAVKDCLCLCVASIPDHQPPVSTVFPSPKRRFLRCQCLARPVENHPPQDPSTCLRCSIPGAGGAGA